MRYRNPLYTLVLALLLACSFEAGPAVAQPAAAGAPDSRPVLRIETGMHTAPIKRIGVDSFGRWLVTGSDDKTVRVWDLATGDLLHTLRPPIGEGNEGKIYAVALSPDGALVACGGFTGRAWDKSACIYLFDRASGLLVRRIAGLPIGVGLLVFSADGRLLAAGLGRNNGLRVFRVSDGSLAGEDKEYGTDSYGADFNRSGRLITTSYDGYLRLYGTDFHLLRKVKAPGGAQPHGARFSPDGERIAIGYNDTPRVDVLSANDLSLLYSPDTSGARGNLEIVCWSADGKRLYAGGTYSDAAGEDPIRCWARGGRGAATDLGTGAQDTVFDLQPLRSGGLVFGSAEPCWGVLDSKGTRMRLQPASIADYRENQAGFQLSADARVVRFGFLPFGRSSSRFDVDRLMLESEERPNAADSLHSAHLDAPGLDINDWKHTTTPTCNGKALPLNPFEVSRSLAVAPDGARFLLGAEWNLRCFAADGKLLWSKPSPGVVWAVNISADGRLGVAAYGDGTIRWHRMSDGKELLTLFPHADRKRWVLWSPSGYYACSPGGEDLIGWHRNNGKEAAADFFPASRLRETFYRPDVIALLLGTLDEGEAIKLADAEGHRKSLPTDVVQNLPPVVRILSPEEGAGVKERSLTLNVGLRSPSGEPITEVRALVDGRPVSLIHKLETVMVTADGEEKRDISLALPDHDCEVSVLAANAHATSVPAIVRLKWKGPDEDVARPNLYILAVGVSKYQDPALTLHLAAADAREFAALFQKQEGGLYGKVTVKLLTDADAAKDAILDGLDWLSKETTSRDVAMFFFSGHGDTDPTGDYYFIPADYSQGHLRSHGIAGYEIAKAMKSIAGKVLFFMDTCHAGAAAGTAKTKSVSPLLAGVINDLASAENGAVVFSASTGSEVAQEEEAWGHGAFTKALLEGLQGKADVNKSGRVTVTLLDAYIAERVKALTDGTQHPTTTKPPSVPDFPIAVTSGN